jgi:hypothetical protein
VVKRLRSINELEPDIFDAIKRAYIKMGIVPKPKQEIIKKQQERKPTTSHQADKPPKPEESESLSDSIKSKKEADESTPNAEDGGGGPEKEQQKTSPKQPKPEQTLHEITANADDVLFEASTVFPFTLVPDTITLDREKLTIANRYFWKTANITSTPVSEIMSCEANLGPIFGSLHLTFRFFTDNVREIKFFWREDAMNFQRMMHGYIIANRKEIDVSHIPTPELIQLLDRLGTGATD